MAWYDRARDWLEPRLIRLSSHLGREWTSVAAVIEHDNQLLALRFGDRYELPGGLVKPGETVEHAVQREVEEETGLHVRIDGIIERRQGRIDRIPHIFLHGNVTGGDIRASLEGRPEWVHLDTVQDRRWRQDHTHIHAYLETGSPETL